MAKMGHGDRLVLADANFPAHSVGKDAFVIRQDGILIPELLSEVLKLFPLDHFNSALVIVMRCQKVNVERGVQGSDLECISGDYCSKRSQYIFGRI